MLDLVAESIMQKFNGNSIFKNALSGGLYFQQAPQIVSSPYGVFYFISVTQEEIMGDAFNNITQIDVQFSLFDETDGGGGSITSLAGQLDDCFHWTVLDIDGWNCIKFQREALIDLGFTDEIWQSVTDYNLWIQKE